MSIISDSLRKAEKGRMLSSRKKGVPVYRPPQSEDRAWVLPRDMVMVCLVLVFTGVLGGSFYYFFEEGTKMLSSGLRTPPSQIIAPSQVVASVPMSPAPQTEAGLGRYAVEEKPFHQVGGFTARTGDPLFILNGIAQNEDGFLAVINDMILRKGDEIEGARVVDISLNRVALEMNKERIYLENQEKTY